MFKFYIIAVFVHVNDILAIYLQMKKTLEETDMSFYGKMLCQHVSNDDFLDKMETTIALIFNIRKRPYKFIVRKEGLGNLTLT